MAPPITLYVTPAELPKYGVNEKALRPIALDIQAEACEAASRFLDSFVRGRVVFPLVQVGSDWKRAAGIIAVYDLMAVRGFSGESGADEILQVRYDEIVAWLKLIADGKAFPDITGSGSGDAEGRPSGGGRPMAVSSGQQGWSTRGTNVRRGPFQND